MNDVVRVTKKQDEKVIKVFDNFLDHNDRDTLENGLFDETFPWYYNKHTVYPDNKYFKSDNKNLYDNEQLVHGFTMYQKINSTYTYLPLLVWNKFVNTTQRTDYQVLRMKANLAFLNNKMSKDTYSIPHIDLDEEHQTLIYYVNYFFNVIIETQDVPYLTSIWGPQIILSLIIITNLIRINEK